MNIFNYLDFRKFLADAYRERKASLPGFTYATVAARAGFRSPGYFTQLLQGKSKLSEAMAPSLARVFGLEREELEYFLLLVRFNQARTSEQKQVLFRELIDKRNRKIQFIDSVDFEILGTWYIIAMRELLNFFPFAQGGDYAGLARMLSPPISPAQARQAIEVLAKHGMIASDEAGIYRLTRKAISTGVDDHPFAVQNFVLKTADLAKEALERLPREQRVLSCLTGSVSQQGFDRIQERLNTFRAELLQIIREDAGVDRVVQINLQAFPISQVYKEEQP